jgi:hypothetical protein
MEEVRSVVRAYALTVAGLLGAAIVLIGLVTSVALWEAGVVLACLATAVVLLLIGGVLSGVD